MNMMFTKNFCVKVNSLLGELFGITDH